MSYYQAKRSQIAKQYLEQRNAEEVIAERRIATERYTRSQAWIAKYQARGIKTAFNWSPTITVTKPEETTSVEKGYEEGVFTEIPQPVEAAEVGVAEGVGDPPQERSAPGDDRGRGQDGAASGHGEARWGRDQDTPF